MLDCQRPVKKIAAGAKLFTPMIDEESQVSSQFFVENTTNFRDIFERGGEVYIQDSKPIVKFNEICFFIKRKEQFQLVREIFLNHEYNFQSSRDAIFIDIGMNCGFTSLYAANLGHVKEVHGFEPFDTPFGDALENFKLNPELTKKITPYRFGLSGDNSVLTVSCNTESTIGVSIRGQTSRSSQEIQVRDASEVLSPLISKAEEGGQDVVLKLDCEGSEFPIFETLVRYDMLSRVDLLLVEWHKWWSLEASQRDLILPLLKENFVVFDRSRASNLYAGTFFAVRRN